MLAKIWKKLLLAICIIACIYNVMHKLVTRTPLEAQLRSVQNQESLLNFWQKVDEVKESFTKNPFKRDDETSSKNENSEENQIDESKNEEEKSKIENKLKNEENEEENTIVVVY